MSEARSVGSAKEDIVFFRQESKKSVEQLDLNNLTCFVGTQRLMSSCYLSVCKYPSKSF